MKSNSKILIIDDENNIRRMLRAALLETDFELIEAGSGREGISAIATHQPDVVILDLGLPDLDGIECIKGVRQWSTTPIIVLSARGEERYKVQALEIGANDYVTKPFSMPELIARIKVALRLHRPQPENTILEVAGLKIDFEKHEVIVRGSTVHLTPLEYKLLTLLARNAGRVMTHRQILTEVWGPAYAGQNHYLRILMKALRHKVEADATRPEILITESGIGYRFTV